MKQINMDNNGTTITGENNNDSVLTDFFTVATSSIMYKIGKFYNRLFTLFLSQFVCLFGL